MTKEARNRLDPQAVDRIAELSRLLVPPEERDSLLGDLEAMLSFVEKIARTEEGGVPDEERAPLSLAHLREDEVAPSLPRETALRSAPSEKDGFVCVPSVMEE